LPCITGFLVLYLRSQTPITLRPLLITLTTALIIITSTDVLRFNSPSFNRLYIRVCGPLMRKEEVKGWNGVIWYLIGVVVTLGVYPRDVAVVSILT
jgi:diacylglycerol kinase (CTP)